MEKSKLNEKNSYVSEKYPLESEQPMTTKSNINEEKCSKKKKMIIIFSIFFILILTILIVFLLYKRFYSNNPIITQEITEFTSDEINEENVIDLDYKKNYIFIYNETQSKISNIEFNEDITIKKRRNEENIISQKSEIISKYLINIYDNKTENSKIIYYAYAIIIEMGKQIENKEIKNMGGFDIRKDNNINNTIPISKFTFNQNGEILSFKINNNMNETLSSYLYEFIEKVIPKVSNTSFNDKRKLNEEQRKFEGDRNNGKIYHIKPNLINENNGNKEEKSWEITIDKNKVKNVIGLKKFSLSINQQEKSINFDKNNLIFEIEDDENVNRGGFIKQITNDINSNITLNEISNDETLTNKISNLLNNINFNDYNYERRLNERKLNGLKNLQENSIFTYLLPIYFSYPLFKINLLGAKITLIASVEFIPIEGNFNMKMIFDYNGNKTVIFSEKKETFFKKISLNIYEILELYYLFIHDKMNLIQSIFNENELKINEMLNQLNNSISNIPKIQNIFSNELNQVLIKINQTIFNTYNSTNEIVKSISNSINLLPQIKNGNENNVNNIKLIYNSSVETFYNTNKDNLNNLFISWTTFNDKIIEELNNIETQSNNNSSFIFDVDLYYNIKESIYLISKLYKDFDNNTLNAIDAEQTKFQLDITIRVIEFMDSTLKEVEIIGNNAKYNIYVIDAMKNIDDDKRKELIENIFHLRDIIYNMEYELLSQIRQIIINLISSEEYKQIINDYNIKYNTINTQKEEINRKLRIFNKYDENFVIYFEDIKLLNDLDIIIYKEKKRSFQKNIGHYINNQSDYFITEYEINNIKSTIKNYFKELEEYLNNNDFYNSTIKSVNFNNIVNEINNKYLKEEFGNKIINFYSKNAFLNTIIDNYYNDLKTTYNKYKELFFDKNYKNHKDNYIFKPTEIINKLSSILNSVNSDISILYKNIEDLLLRKIDLGIYFSTIQIYDIIQNEYNLFLKNINNKSCCKEGNNFENVKIIKENLKKFNNLYFDENNKFIPLYIYNNNKEDKFKIKNIIIPKENSIRNNLKEIIEQINNDFNCNNISCNNTVSQIDNYYYQISKIRISLSYIKSIIPIFQSTIEENVLSNLNIMSFLDLFENELNNKENELLIDINSFINELNYNTSKIINPTLQSLKVDIKNYVESKINIENIKEHIKIIANLIFINPQELYDEINSYLQYYSAGPISKIKNGFNMDIEYYKRISGNNFTFDYESYKKSFDELHKKIKESYINGKNNLLKDFKISEMLIDTLSQNISDFIIQSFDKISQEINSLVNITNFQFLNMNFSIQNYIEEILNETIKSINNININEIISNIYNDYYGMLKNKIKDDLDNIYKTLDAAIYNEYESNVHYYQRQQYLNERSGKIIIKEIHSETKDILYKVIQTLFMKINEVYSTNNINEFLIENQNNVLKEYIFELNNEDLSNYIKDDINQISQINYNRLIQEKNIFQNNITNLYKKSYYNIINEFLNNKGNEYLNYIFNYDYQNNVFQDINIMNSTIIELCDIINSLMDLSEMKSLPENLVNKINNFLPEIKNEILNFSNKIEKSIDYDLNLLTYNLKYIFIDRFILYFGSVNTKNYSSQIKELIPKYLDDSFKGYLDDNLYTNIHNKFQTNKNEYKTKLNKDLQSIGVIIEEKEKVILNKIKNIEIQQTNVIFSKIIEYYNELDLSYTKYNNNNLLKIDNKVNEYIESFFIKINDDLKNITNKFNEEKQNGKLNLEQILTIKDNYLSNLSLVEINNSDMKKQTSQIQNNLSLLMENLEKEIINKFKDFSNFLNEETQDIIFEGFNSKNDLRNLEEYIV